jgi:hypothetical protein
MKATTTCLIAAVIVALAGSHESSSVAPTLQPGASGQLALRANSPQAQFTNSLWIGTDNSSGRLVLNTDRTGALLRSVGPVEATGFAIDLNANIIYFGTSLGGTTPRDLTTTTAGASFSASGTEDMTFDGQFIWRAGAPGPAASTIITKIDPVTHQSTQGFTVPFQALGIAWDGSGFWIAEFALNGLVQRFDAAGTPTAVSFHTTGGSTNGGVAFDPTDNTLYIGTSNKVFHYATTGTSLGSFTIPGSDGRFVDGLEFEGTVPGVPAGRVPASAPGVPLTLTKSGSDLTLQWGASCIATDADYEVYEGTLGTFFSHLPRLCTTGGLLAATITPSPGDRYYLVVPRNDSREGSYGVYGSGTERPMSFAACLAQTTGSCP